MSPERCILGTYPKFTVLLYVKETVFSAEWMNEQPNKWTSKKLCPVTSQEALLLQTPCNWGATLASRPREESRHLIFLDLLFFFNFLVLPVYCYQPISLHPCSHMLSHVIPWTSARQTPLSMDFSRHEYWSGLPFPFPWTHFLKFKFYLFLIGG